MTHKQIAAAGSSPLARGKHGGDRKRRQGSRLIPARAGKTDLAVSGRLAAGAHPRSRGENRLPGHCYTALSGSSPLARGKPVFRTAWTADNGLIPARAGKT